MRHYFKTILFAASIFSLIIVNACKTEEEPDIGVVFSGQVLSGQDPVDSAKVIVNGNEVLSLQNGEFKIEIDPDVDGYLVHIEKFGFGLFSKSFTNGFENKEIQLTEGTVIEFDPTIDTTLVDTNSENTILQSTLLQLDTSLLFGAVPKVYDHQGNLIDLGYPPEIEGILDYVKEPITRRPGMSVRMRANSLRNSAGDPPPAGKKLKASLSTVDFFNPDGMPGNFNVRFQGDPNQFDSLQQSGTKKLSNQNMQSPENQVVDNDENDQSDSKDDDRRDQLAFMESFGAGTIEITDGNESYQLAEGMSATVTIPVYEIRKNLRENIPPVIPLLHYNENDGIWEVTGRGVLNATGDAYVAEVKHFSVVNFDQVKTGDSKCFKIRQMLENGGNSNTASSTFRAHVIVPQSATSTFSERQRVIDETTGCVSVDATSMHGVTRINNDVPYVVTIFSQDGVGATDTLDIAIVAPDPIQSIPAETAVTAAGDCSTACDISVLDCSDATDAVDYGISPCNADCWLPECPIIPFDNSGAETQVIVGVPMGGGDIKVKWVHRNTTIGSLVVAVHDGVCGANLGTIQDLCSTGCIGNSCNGGEIIYPGTVGNTVTFKLTAYNNINCGGIPLSETCSVPVVIL